MEKDWDSAYGALGFEFHKNRLKNFKKGEVVLCMGVGNNYDLPFGWESPFIYSKFVEVFGEHFVATEDGRFSIDRIFKVDKEYRFYVPQIDMHFISYFRMNVEIDGSLIHFEFIDENPKKQNFAIPVKASADYIKNELAYTPGIKLFELRKSSKAVATKSVKKNKPVKPVIENKKSSSSSIIDYFGLQIHKNKERGEDRFHVICNVCERSVAPDHNKPGIFYGFICNDTKMFVCMDCKTNYYINKNLGVYGKEHAYKYSEMPVPVPSLNIPEVRHLGTEIFGSWYDHKRPHELRIENSSVVVTWLDDCQDNISTSRFNWFTAEKNRNEVNTWLLEQGFYKTNDDNNSFKLPEKVVKMINEFVPKLNEKEPVPFITGLHGCKCHPFASWKESDKAHKQKFEVGDQVINRCNKKVGFVHHICDQGGYVHVNYGNEPIDRELKHAAELDILVPVKSPLNKNFKAVATKKAKSVKPVKVTSVETEPVVWPMEKGDFFYTSYSNRLHQFKSFKKAIKGVYETSKPLININALYVMDSQKSYFNDYDIYNGKLKHFKTLDEIIIVKEPIEVEIKFMNGTGWYLLWLNNGTNNDNILISRLESKSIAIEKANKFGFKIVATKSVKPVPVPSADQEPEAEVKNNTTAKRDKKANKRDEIIKFRVTAEVKELIQELAKHDDCTVADLLKKGINKYALTSIKFKTSFDFSKLEIIK
jgi:hypothetical protein